jgi:hypothetical protein
MCVIIALLVDLIDTCCLFPKRSKSQRRTREVQSWPYIDRRSTVPNSPATHCSPSVLAHLKSSNNSLVVVGDSQIHLLTPISLGSDLRLAASPAGGGHGDAAAVPGVRQLRRLRLHLLHLPPPRTHPLPSHIRADTSRFGCCESHRRSAESSGSTVPLIFLTNFTLLQHHCRCCGRTLCHEHSSYHMVGNQNLSKLVCTNHVLTNGGSWAGEYGL